MDFPVFMEAGIWLCDREYRFLATNETLDSFDDHKLTGIALHNECLQKIFSDNLLKKLGGKPKEINKEALKKYIEKFVQSKKIHYLCKNFKIKTLNYYSVN